MVKNPTLETAYKYLLNQLGSFFEANEIFEHITKKSYYQHRPLNDTLIDKKDWAELKSLIEKRLEGKPLQYLLGSWEFYSLPFYVGEGVLIPRPDTETLVDMALELMGKNQNLEVLDLCAGSGCVGISIDKNTHSKVTCVELSDSACHYLNRNIALNKSGVSATKADVLEYKHPVGVDIIVSNPPYIPTGQLQELQVEVQYEPKMALDGGIDGLNFYRTIIKHYNDQLNPLGYIIFEIGINQQDDLIKLLEQYGFNNIACQKDLSGIIRVVWGQKI